MKTKELKLLSLLTEIASLYYEKGLSQAEIAERMFLSRTRISRLLKMAEEKGIVEIRVNHAFERNYALEDRFRQRYGLKDVFLYGTFGKSPEEVKAGVSMLAAEYLKKRIARKLVLGVSWGSTVAETVQALNPDREHPIDVVQIMGAASMENHTVNASEIISRLARTYGGTPHFLNAPLFIENDYVRQQILLDPGIANVLDMALNADIVLTGIGTPDQVTTNSPWLGYMSKPMLQEIRDQHAVGCIGARFFDAQGQELANEWNRRCIGISLQNLRRMDEVVVAAAGVEKAEAILGAIRGGYVKVLATDSDTADRMMELK